MLRCKSETPLPRPQELGDSTYQISPRSAKNGALSIFRRKRAALEAVGGGGRPRFPAVRPVRSVFALLLQLARRRRDGHWTNVSLCSHLSGPGRAAPFFATGHGFRATAYALTLGNGGAASGRHRLRTLCDGNARFRANRKAIVVSCLWPVAPGPPRPGYRSAAKLLATPCDNHRHQ